MLKTIINTKYSAFGPCLLLSMCLHALGWFCVPDVRNDLRFNDLLNEKQTVALDQFIEVKLPNITGAKPGLSPVPLKTKAKTPKKTKRSKKRLKRKRRAKKRAKKTRRVRRKISPKPQPASPVIQTAASPQLVETVTPSDPSSPVAASNAESISDTKEEGDSSNGTSQQVGRKLSKQELRGLLKGYYNHLNLLMASKRNYPRSARRLGIEGKVLIELVINRQGVITSVKIAKSSGHEMLDRAAITQVSQMKKVPSFPQQINKRSMTFRIGFDYTLQS